MSEPSSIAPSPAPSQTTLYEPRVVGIATFLGSPIAGAIVMAINYKRLGKVFLGLLAIVLAVIGTVAVIALASSLPSNALSIGIAVALVVLMMWLTKMLQGRAIESHRAAGGNIGSSAIGWVTGLIFLVLIFGTIFAWAYLTPPIPGTRIVVGTKDEIFYSGTTTQSETQSLGKQLQVAGFFQDRGVSVKFSRDTNGTLLGFVVNDGVWNDTSMVTAFEDLARRLAPTIGGLPIKLQMMDAAGEVKKEWLVHD